MKDYYAILGITPSATLEEIKAAYREKAKQYHPDRVSHLGPEFQELAERRMKELNEAYEFLIKSYDDNQERYHEQYTSEQNEETTKSKTASETSEDVKASKFYKENKGVSLRFFYLAMTIISFIVSIIVVQIEGFHGSAAIVIASILGRSASFLTFPAIVIGISRFVSYIRKNKFSPAAHIAVFSVTWFAVAVFSILGALYESKHILQFNRSPTVFTVEGCEYSVTFPGEPKYINAFDPNIGDYTCAEFIADDRSNGFFLRAECIPTGDIRYAAINTKEFLQKMIVEYATNNGLQNCSYSYGEDVLGKHMRVYGFKIIDDIPVTCEGYIYVGNKSFIFLFAVGESATYPQSGVYEFLKSLRRK